MGALTDKYCIVGVGETPHFKAAGRTQLSLACEAIMNAINDAGLQPEDIDGMTSYQIMDSCSSTDVASALGLSLNYGVDVIGGGSSGEMLIANAIGIMEGGYAKAFVIFRSMLGRTGLRMGGQAVGGPRAASPAAGGGQWGVPIGRTSPAQSFSWAAMRHMRDYGTTTRHFGEIAVAHRYHASLNPKAYMKTPITLEDHQNSRWIVKPLRLLDCCLETDVAVAIVVAPRERAYDLRHPPVFIKGGIARTSVPNPSFHWMRAGNEPYTKSAGFYGAQRVWAMSGHRPEDMDATSAYDAFTYTTLVQLEAYGFCKEGEGGPYVEGGRIQLDGVRPNNVSGGHLSEGYTHGVNMVIEHVRQLRHRADDYCPDWMHGEHTYDRSKGCRQMRKVDLVCAMGWGGETQASAVVLGNRAG